MLASAGVINPLSYCKHAVLQCIYATEYHHLQPSDSFVQPAADFLDQLANRLTDDDPSSSQLKGQTQPTIIMSNVPTTVWSPRVFVRAARLVISGARPVFCGFWVPQFFCAKGWTGTDQLCRFMGQYKGRLEWTNPFALVLNFWDTCTWVQLATESMTAVTLVLTSCCCCLPNTGSKISSFGLRAIILRFFAK